MIDKIKFCEKEAYEPQRDTDLADIGVYEKLQGKVLPKRKRMKISMTNNLMMFRDVFCKDEGNFYSYNPCVPFIEGSCRSAAVCILNPDKSQQIQIGDASSATFKVDEIGGNVVATYTSNPHDLIVSKVNLVCDPNACVPVIEAQGQQNDGSFKMTLTTVCACPGMCDSNGPKTNCSVCNTKYAEFTKSCDRGYDGKEEAIKVLIINNWDGVCKFPDNDDVAFSLNNDKSTCEDVINRCNPSQSFSVNGYMCKTA
ncbi:uncharacterized protein LOC128545951 [Mercenaria mercenaria]|uniref:uncharacterized protein LOC128545951 n=1 Tax=Mercenaria mercenaria TaxID=6596 RepID=UPI00234EDAA2|nr:uncharacterized protein LOC128545951 [Mercenaria mercenaria]